LLRSRARSVSRQFSSGAGELAPFHPSTSGDNPPYRAPPTHVISFAPHTPAPAITMSSLASAHLALAPLFPAFSRFPHCTSTPNHTLLTHSSHSSMPSQLTVRQPTKSTATPISSTQPGCRPSPSRPHLVPISSPRSLPSPSPSPSTPPNFLPSDHDPNPPAPPTHQSQTHQPGPRFSVSTLVVP
jgi:hypothetical protein